ncbi:MAG: HAMP domain-containing protein [Chloroflexi bacterium]|jgi:signal transduction histidine kinase|nr:HAMP domain-containing protein [Chloroflexota bacterium]
MKIWIKILTVVVAVVLFTGIVTILVSRTMSKNTIADEVSNHLVTVLQSRSHEIETTLEYHKKTVELMAQGSQVYLTQGTTDIPEDQKVAITNLILSNMVDPDRAIHEALLMDENGIIFATSHPDKYLGLDASDSEVFLGAQEGAYVGHVTIGEATGDLVLAIAAPIQITPVATQVIVFIGGMEQLFEITTDATGLGETGEVYIVNEEGYMITPSRFREDAVLTQQIEGHTPGDFSAEIEDGAAEGTNYTGSKVLTAHTHLPELGWTVIVEKESSEAFAPVSNLTNTMVWALAGILGVAILCAVILSRMLSKPIVRLRQGTEEIMKGNWEYDVSTSAKDEVGELSRTFSQMTADLKKSQDELRLYGSELEQTVMERTNELAGSNEELKKEIAERKRAEEGQTELLDQLEKANRELTDFAYIASHDLKAPLRAITSLAEWLSNDYREILDEWGQQQLDLLQNRTRRMDSLVDGILQYSRLGRSKEDAEEADLDIMVSEVVDAIDPPENIEVRVATELPTIVCEKIRIQQIFQNLLSNAVKYMDKPRGTVIIGCAEVDAHWKFSVTDNGPGIEEKYYDKIFQIFQTLIPRDEVESTGIGLSIVKRIVEAHGGEVWVESVVGEGSTFFFTLPKVLTEEVRNEGTVFSSTG